MPYIGISPRIDKKQLVNNEYEFLSINITYCRFIENLGYNYLILPLKIDYHILDICDGFVIPGGDDINPQYYNEKNTFSKIEPDIIDQMDFQIIEYAMRYNKFVLGICRGIQVINVFFGGTLVQDLGDANQLHHNNHEIKMINKNDLAKLFNSIEFVNSLHHQSIKKIGKNLVPIFQTNEIIEMIIHNKYKIIGVQWHPERMNIMHQLKFKKLIEKLNKKKNL